MGSLTALLITAFWAALLFAAVGILARYGSEETHSWLDWPPFKYEDAFVQSKGRFLERVSETEAQVSTGEVAASRPLAGATANHSTQMSHLLIDAYNLPFDFLNSSTQVQELLDSIASHFGLTVVGRMSRQFDPHGFTALYLLSESHLSVHSWPEAGFAAFDLLTCGRADLMQGVAFIRKRLEAVAPEVDFRFSHTARGVQKHEQVNDVAVMSSELQTTRELLVKRKSRYQTIEVWDVEGTSLVFGEAETRKRILFLDGVMQLDTSDEATYHESLVHPMMLAHAAPRRVCILGGGDGGALREALGHRSVESAVLVDIDQEVARVAADLLPSLAFSFHDPRAELVFKDAFEWIHSYPARSKAKLDAIIVDLLDLTFDSPLIDFLYTDGRLDRFIGDLRLALDDDGIVVSQLGELTEETACSAGTRQRHPDCKALRRQFMYVQSLQRVFKHTHVYSVYIPSFLGKWTFAMATDSPSVAGRWSRDAATVDEDISTRLMSPLSLTYFNGLAMQGMRVQAPIWTQMEAILDPSKPGDATTHECNHLQPVAANSNLPGYQIPYRLARSTVGNGVGVYTLRRIRRGEVIWRFYPESFIHITQDNWKKVVADQIRRRNWKAAPDLDAAADNATFAGSESSGTTDVAEVAYKKYLQRYWINEWKNATAEDDDASALMFLELDDAKYTNYGYTTNKGHLLMASSNFELERNTAKAYDDDGAIIALQDIEACSELLENYWSRESEAEGGFEAPSWWRDVLNSTGALDYLMFPAFRYKTNVPANMD